MTNISVFNWKDQNIKVLAEDDARWFFSASDLSRVLPVKSQDDRNNSCDFIGYELTDLMAIASEKQNVDESIAIMDFVGAAKRSGYVTATIERLYVACRMYEAWKSSKELDNSSSEQQEKVYLIGCKENKTMKIGYSKDIKSRLTSLQTSSPYQLTVLSNIKGSKNLEKNLHKEFGYLRINREWFRWSNEIIEKFNLLKEIELLDED